MRIDFTTLEGLDRLNDGADLSWALGYYRGATQKMLDWGRKQNPRLSAAKDATRFFGVESDNCDQHSLCIKPLDWGFTFSEPQITKAIVSAIDHCDSKVKAARVASFLDALDYPFGESDLLKFAIIEAEKLTPDGKRIDIYISWSRKDSTKRTVVIEAKLRAKLSEHQLNAYSEPFTDTANETVHYYFLAFDFNGKDMEQLCSAKEPWHIISWFTLLKNWELALLDIPDAQYSDASFKLLRSTLWSTTV